jgi:predicted RNA-binding protein Jag
MFDYKLENGKIIRINEKTIENLMDKLGLDREDAIQVYLEDEGYEINEEQEELTQKAKDNKITATIHKAEAQKKERKKIERKPNPDKEDLIASLADFLNELDEVTDVNITNIGKLIEFNFKGKAMKIDLVEKRVKKN